MIRIELDRVHLELLVLAGLFATFSGVVFPPMRWNGMNMTPLVAFFGIGIVGVGALVHRRIFTDSTDTRSRMRAAIWFAVLGAVLGASVSTIVVETPQSRMIAAIGGALMFSSIGTQFGIVIKSHDEAARDAVETILDEQNVFVTPEQLWTEDARGVRGNDRTDAPSRDDEDNKDNRSEMNGESDEIDVSASSDWKQSTSDDNIPIPVIRSVESGEYSEE
jgi:hypothetical protein